MGLIRKNLRVYIKNILCYTNLVYFCAKGDHHNAGF